MFNIQQANANVAAVMEETRQQVEAVYWHPSVEPIRQMINREFSILRSKIPVAPSLSTTPYDDQFPPVTDFLGEKIDRRIDRVESDKSDTPLAPPATPKQSVNTVLVDLNAILFYIPFSRRNSPIKIVNQADYAREMYKHDKQLSDEFSEVARVADAHFLQLISAIKSDDPSGAVSFEPDEVLRSLKGFILSQSAETSNNYDASFMDKLRGRYSDIYQALFKLRKRLNEGVTPQEIVDELTRAK